MTDSTPGIIDALEDLPPHDLVGEILARSEGAAMEVLRAGAEQVVRPNQALRIASAPKHVLALLDEVREARTQHSITECNHMAHETLPRLRKGMLALYERHAALHTCVKRYLEEWAAEAPAGWSKDELEAALAKELPQLTEAIDPAYWFDRREEIEAWVVGCEPSLYAVTVMQLYAWRDGFQVVRKALEEIIDASSDEQAREMLRLTECHPDPELGRRCGIALRALLSTSHLVKQAEAKAPGAVG